MTRICAWMVIVWCLGVAGLTGARAEDGPDDRQVALFAPPELVASGVLKHALPRFALKTQVRVTLVDDPGAAQIVLGSEGRALFEGLGAVWHMEVRAPDHTGTARLADWLTSDVGTRTVQGFAPEGIALFGPPPETSRVVAAVTMDGDALLGHKVSLERCTRCHAVDEATRGAGIGSTPSFAVLRTLSNWEERFTAFYALNPHPAFTIITEVTPPFPEDRPSPIVPIELTLDEVEAVLAYVAAIAPADLGKPLEHQ